jgi:hypothetical protein
MYDQEDHMRTRLDQQNVNQVQTNMDDSHRVLRNYRIDATDRMRLSVAAEAASVTTDELLAVLEDRMRRAASRAAKQVDEHRYELI